MFDRRPPNCGHTLPFGATPARAWPTLRRYSQVPALADRQILGNVTILEPGQAAQFGGAFALAVTTESWTKLTGEHKVVVCVWPDHVAAVLAFDSSRSRPRVLQLIRAYAAAREAAAFSATTEVCWDDVKC